MLRLLEDGTFLVVKGGEGVRLRIRSVATGDDVLKARASGAKAIAAKVFLPEAVEVAGREGVELVNVEDVVGPLASVLKELLRERRPDLLVRFFQEILPEAVARSYSYREYTDYTGATSAVEFSVDAKFIRGALGLFDDVFSLLSAIASKASELGMYTSLNSTSDPRWKERRVVLDLKIDLKT